MQKVEKFFVFFSTKLGLLHRPGRATGRAGTRSIRPLAGLDRAPGRAPARGIRPPAGPDRHQAGRTVACGGTRRSNGRRRPRSGGAPWVCVSASECGVEAVAVHVLGDGGGRTHGGARVRDVARPWWTAERPLARRRGYRAGGGRRRCPGGRRSHQEHDGVVGGGGEDGRRCGHA